MADKAARKAPVRTAPARKDYPTEVAWLQAKLDHAQAEVDKKEAAHRERLNKRIAAVQKQIAGLNAKLRTLEAARDAQTGAQTGEWTEQDHLAAEGKA